VTRRPGSVRSPADTGVPAGLPPRLVAATALVGVAAVLLVTGVGLVFLDTGLGGGRGAPASGSPSPTVASSPTLSQAGAQAARWLATNVQSSASIVLPEDIAEDVRRQPGAPTGLTAYEDLLTGRVDLVVTTAGLRAAAQQGSLQPVTALLPRSVPVARFGSGRDVVEVRQVLADDAETARLVAETGRQARAVACAALAQNPALTLSPPAAAALSAAAVDGRVLTVLDRVLVGSRLSIVRFVGAAGEAGTGTPLRSVQIGAVDGFPVRGSAPPVRALLAELRGQPWELRPASLVVSEVDARPVLVIGYRAPGPVGLP
jgi:hypothetical protein